jgi:predicted O-methyltransferase YrrM
MNAVLAEILDTGRVVTRDGSTVPLNYNIPVEEGAALQRLIKANKPRVTLEIGFAYGISTLFICEALAEVGGERHIVIDPLQKDGWQGIGLYNVERAGFASLLEFHNGPSHQVLPALEQAGRRVDLALIDGWHTFDYVLVDFFFVDRLLNVGGIVMLDDTRFYPAIRKVARYVATHRQYVALGNGLPIAKESLKRTAFRGVTAVLRQPPLQSLTRFLMRPDILQTDRELGLPADNFIAFQKMGDDILGDGTKHTRKWDQHIDF